MQFIRRSNVDDLPSHVVLVVALRAEDGRAVGRSGGSHDNLIRHPKI